MMVSFAETASLGTKSQLVFDVPTGARLQRVPFFNLEHHRSVYNAA